MKYYVIYYRSDISGIGLSGWVTERSDTTFNLEEARKYDINMAHRHCDDYNMSFSGHSVQEVDTQ